MDGEAHGPIRSQRHMLPAFPSARQAWQPIGARGRDSLLSRIFGGLELFLGKAAGLQGWHERCTRRILLWGRWLPLSYEFAPENGAAEGKEPAVAMAVPLSRNPEFRFPRGALTPATHLSNPAVRERKVTQPQRFETVLARPTINPAVLTRVEKAANMMRRGEAGNYSQSPVPHSPRRAHHPLPWRGLPPADAPMLQARLGLVLSPVPRREVPGGFPVSRDLATARREAEQIRTEPAAPPSPRPNAGQLDTWAPTSQHAVTPLNRLSKAESAIEKLIEHTVAPVSLPGLELRPAPRGMQSFAGQRQAHEPTEDRRSEAHRSTAPRPGPIPAPPPQLDINAVADKVYQTLLRRQQVERERRGLY